ncbi:uncharacterized protein AB675_6757 [Cyphellophora attinorum]|uniref:Uncharacterized protein n=1 Tax=Cyphellophora attinorum TaxID=1664694 RepID=A0A0N0NQ74_9EURO|nr:uncharacterized protein AB675_6757 [Phialophora attinorum]KPI43578.1 hypothetical protein AB675_6757 [Phialophora attinorum]
MALQEGVLFSPPTSRHPLDQLPSFSDPIAKPAQDITIQQAHLEHNTSASPSSTSPTTQPSYSFASTNLPRELRAWQRQAAQPFAPRNDAHTKIWKRPRQPLSDIVSASNTRWRRGGYDDEEALRSSKRVKLRQDVEGKENEVMVAVNDVSTEPVGEGEDLVAGQPSPGETAEQDAEGDSKYAEEGEAPTKPMQDHTETEAQIHARPQPEQITIEVQSDQNNSQTSEFSQQQDDVFQSENTLSEAVVHSEDHTHELAEATEVADSQDEPSAEALFTEESYANKGGAELPSFETFADNIFALPHNERPAQGQTDGKEASASPIATDKDQNAASANTHEDEDTAYLHQFLQRAKEAREKNQTATLYRPVGDRIKQHLQDQQNNPTSPTAKRPASPEPPEISDSDSDEATMTMTSTLLVPSIEEDQSEQAPSSPSRRSNRLTKLPRPAQRIATLPSNISLRRLNGTEFVAMAKSRTEAQNAALLVRNNTRKNKDGALSVSKRLAQIKLGLIKDGSNQSDGSNGSQPNSEEEAKDNKRKATHKDNKRRLKQCNVTWAAKIARFRDDDGEEYDVLTESEGEEEKKMTAKDYMAVFEAREAQKTSDEGEAANDEALSPPGSPSKRTRAKLAKLASVTERVDHVEGASQQASIPQATATSKSTKTVDEESAQKSKSTHKRKRKQAQGSLNGTPAPSKRNFELAVGVAPAASEQKSTAAVTIADNGKAAAVAVAVQVPAQASGASQLPRPSQTVEAGAKSVAPAAATPLANTKRIRMTRSARAG